MNVGVRDLMAGALADLLALWAPPVEFRTPRGWTAQFVVRPRTSDWNTVNACCHEDEYGLAEREWTGTAIDVGAHVGGATVALLLDNPNLRVVAVEALPENVALLRENLRFNGLSDRATVIEGAADSGSEPVRIAYGSTETEFAREHEFIGGGIWHDEATDRKVIESPPVSLSSIVAEHGPISLLKIDCEGGEWSFLDDPAVSEVAEIRGEWHPRQGYGVVRLHELLDATHVLSLDETLDFGLFRAVRR